MDLHIHSTASDGSLTPVQVLERARKLGLDCVSITDHDSVSAYTDELVETAGIEVIPGIEFSTTWQGRNIHILGLNIDTRNQDLANGVQQQKNARKLRAQKIAGRLEKATGIEMLLERATELANGGAIGRPHFAAAMLQEGAVASLDQAYKRYLGNGKKGDVRTFWAEMIEIVEWIRCGGGTAVLAHPGHYRLTNRKLRQLSSDFQSCGGQAIEVTNGIQDNKLTEKLGALCVDLGMSASCGSDFHSPGSAWSEIGRYSPLPASCVPVWEDW